ncbi:MAG: hypothetical protein ACOCXO_06830, partial [Bacteroidota bacterium]
MRKLACLCLLFVFFAGSLSAQVVSDPEQIRDLSMSLKIVSGIQLDHSSDHDIMSGFGVEAEYFHNRKWSVYVSALSCFSLDDALSNDDFSPFKNTGYIDLAGGYSLLSFEKSREIDKRVTYSKGGYMGDTIYWVKNKIEDISKNNLLVRGGLRTSGNSIYEYRYANFAEDYENDEFHGLKFANYNYKVISPFLGVEYRISSGYSYVIRKEYHHTSQQISIFADVFLTSFLDDNVEIYNPDGPGTVFPGIVSDDPEGMYL